VKATLRGRLVFVTLAVVAALGLAAVIALESDLREQQQARMQEALMRYADAARALFEVAPLDMRQPPAALIARIDPLADRLGGSVGARVTVIAEDGTVLGDSSLPPDAVAKLENHGARPEVRAALREDRGVSERHSATLDDDLLYVAVPFRRADAHGAVRVALPLAQIGGR
jgi:two-component system phosphate regulon sensor histidine kinase PhoR